MLPEGTAVFVLFSDPDQACAAVVMQKPSSNIHNTPLEWVQIDLKSGQVTGRVPLTAQGLAKAALSPSGKRLAASFREAEGSILVWDSAGKKIQQFSGNKPPGGEWLAFASEDRLLAVGGGKLTAIDIATGRSTFTANQEVKSPAALSPGRKWVAATNAKNELNVFGSADGSVAGRWSKAHLNGMGVTALAFRQDGAELSAMFRGGLISWDMATGKPTRAVRRQNGGTHGHPWEHLHCLGSKHMLFYDYLYDAERNLGLWRYTLPHPAVVGQSASPDGRLWAAGSFKSVIERAKADKLTPGPVRDAAMKGTPILAAYTAPHAEVLKRLDAGEAGIIFRYGKPIRIEVVGSGSRENKLLVAESTAEAVVKRGIPVDPAATIGLRIELSPAVQKRIVFVAPGTPPGFEPKTPGSLNTVLTVRTWLFNSETGALSKAATASDHRTTMSEGWEEKFYKAIGSTIGTTRVPVSGYYNANGEEVGLMHSSDLGIDGVVE